MPASRLMVDAADELRNVGRQARASLWRHRQRRAEDTGMYFRTECVRGVEAIKKFFVKISEPLNITHEVLEYWTAEEGVCFLRGEATMARKAEPATVVRAPFMHIYYLGTTEPVRIETLRITAGPLQTDTVM